MLKFLLPVAFALLILVKPMQVSCSAEDRLKYAITRLTGEILNKQVKMNPETTVTTSGFPLISMLAALALFSTGSTQEELLKILNLNNCNEIRSVLPKYIARFNRHGNNTSASALHFQAFTDKSDQFTNSFIEDFGDILDGDTQSINYGCPNKAARIINEWVKDYTFFSKSKDVITADEIPNDLGKILVGTQEFQINWDNPSNPTEIVHIEFHVNDADVVTFPALYGDWLMKYAVVDCLECVVIEIFMKGNKNSVVFVFPDEIESLPDIIDRLKDPDCFYKVMDMLETRCIKAYIPLAEVHAVIDYKQILQQIFSTSIFDPETAEFCDISQGGNQVYVSSILHQLHVVGNAGANESNSNPKTTSSNHCAGRSDLPFLNLNHPLVFYIMEKHYNVPMSGGVFYKNT